MHYKNLVTALVFLVLIGGGFILWTQYRSAPGDDENTFCAADVRSCPDGSSVGRVPPACEFAACPAERTTEVELEARLNRSVSALGVTITPRQVLEDSRCPVDVTCIQAGTVRVRADLTSGLGAANQIFELGKPITTETEIVELIGVGPQSISGRQIDASQYRFTFRISKRPVENGGKD